MSPAKNELTASVCSCRLFHAGRPQPLKFISCSCIITGFIQLIHWLTKTNSRRYHRKARSQG
jgi:hypothetical protein